MPLTINLDRSDEFADLMPDALDAGLIGAGYVYRNEVMRGLAGGYTTGAFVTGRVMNSVTISDPYDGDNGGRAISVGTDVDYAAFWEQGHMNLFTRQFERVEIWGPALDSSGPEMMDVFSELARSYMESD